jgi:hypothetical protein
MSRILTTILLTLSCSPLIFAQPETSIGVAFSQSREAAVSEACTKASLNPSVCSSGLKFVTNKVELSRCVKRAECINMREPNIPYSEDEYVCSGTVSGVCKAADIKAQLMNSGGAALENSAVELEIVTDGIVTERVYNINELIDFSKVVQGRTPTVLVKGVRMYPDCNGPRGDISGFAKLDAEKSRFTPYYRISVSYAATRMGCGDMDYTDNNLKTFLFSEPLSLSVKENERYILLTTKDHMIRSLILEFRY